MKVTTLVLLVTLLAVAPAFALYVPADGTTVIVPTAIGWYDINVFGTFSFGGPGSPSALADAEWICIAGTWTENYTAGSNDLCDLAVNETLLDWQGKVPTGEYLPHSFSPEHRYRARVYAESELRLRVYDLIYSRNVGRLMVEIQSTETQSAFPEPSGLIALGGGLAGLVGIIKKHKQPCVCRASHKASDFQSEALLLFKFSYYYIFFAT